MTQVRDGGDLLQGDDTRAGERWSNSGYTLKVEPGAFAVGPDVGSDRKTQVWRVSP